MSLYRRECWKVPKNIQKEANNSEFVPTGVFKSTERTQKEPLWSFFPQVLSAVLKKDQILREGEENFSLSEKNL